MKDCVLRFLSLLLSLATVCAVAQSARADNDGVLDFAVPASGTAPAASIAMATLPAQPPISATTDSTARASDSAALSFDPAATVPTPAAPLATATKAADVQLSDLFAGGSNSLVARAVGHAEGTRTADGSKTRAYYGHSDPGNGVWNLGSFSYQHGAKSPQDADEKQLQRLQQQRETLRQKATTQRLSLSLEEELNAIDLANQAPLAALDTPGYVEWLKKAHDRGLTGSEAVLWARTQSYWNPRQQRWEAPGLGNTESNISYDQNRRQTAIARALEVYEQQALARRQEDKRSVKVADKPPDEKVADQIIFQHLPLAPSTAIAQSGY